MVFVGAPPGKLFVAVFALPAAEKGEGSCREGSADSVIAGIRITVEYVADKRASSVKLCPLLETTKCFELICKTKGWTKNTTRLAAG